MNFFHKKFIYILIATGLTTTWYFNACKYATCALTPYIALGTFQHFQSPDGAIHPLWEAPDYMDVWKMRLFTVWLAGKLFAFMGVHDTASYTVAFGIYNAAFVGATFAVLIWFLKNPLLFMFAMFAGMWFPTVENPVAINIQTWDTPIIFAWTLAFFLWRARHFKTFCACVVLGTFFKESIAMLAILLLFVENSNQPKK